MRFEFLPSSEQASKFDAEMQRALRESVLSLADQAHHILPDRLARDIANWSEQSTALHPVSPSGFGAYYDCVQALQSGHRFRARKLFRDIISEAAPQPDVRIKRLGVDYSRRASNRFQRYMGNGKTDASGIAKCHPRDAERFTAALKAAFDILSESSPGLYAEFQTLIRDIILVAPDGSHLDEFEGGTCFKLWGALFLNAESEASPLQLAITLAHEEGHAVLFGMCRDEMLVENLDDERHWSPIRQAERPLEGIFHATFVSARMVNTIRDIQRRRALTAVDKEQATQDLEQALKIYSEGVEIVAQKARFTTTGKAVFDGMTASMRDLLADA